MNCLEREALDADGEPVIIAVEAIGSPRPYQFRLRQAVISRAVGPTRVHVATDLELAPDSVPLAWKIDC